MNVEDSSDNPPEMRTGPHPEYHMSITGTNPG